MKQIVQAASNNIVRSESDKNWFLQYENIRVGKPSKMEDMVTQAPRLQSVVSTLILCCERAWLSSSLTRETVEGVHLPIALYSTPHRLLYGIKSALDGISTRLRWKCEDQDRY